MEKRIDWSIVSLIAANLVPILGVWMFNWNVLSIIFFYWLESCIIFFFFIIKFSIGLFFARKYKKITIGRFTFLALVWLLVISILVSLVYAQFWITYIIYDQIHGGIDKIISSINFSEILLSSLSLFISHGISFFVNFIGKKEYFSAGHSLTFPYRRVYLMYIVIIIGGIVSATRAPIFTTTLFIIGKILVDIYTHNKEHEELKKEKHEK